MRAVQEFLVARKSKFLFFPNLLEEIFQKLKSDKKVKLLRFKFNEVCLKNV
jgi:hypothetical protein